MLYKCSLELLKQAYLHLWRDLPILVKLVGAREHRLGERGHPVAAYPHTPSLKDGVNQTLDRVFKHDITNIADLMVTLCSHTRVQNEAMPAEFLHLALKASNFSEACRAGRLLSDKY